MLLTVNFYYSFYSFFLSQVFVVDSSSNDDDVDLAAAELKEALSHPSLETLPLLVLANKQDVQGARSADEVSNKSFSSLTSKCIKI